jgi:multidrug efflux pump subunit AcrA (membrane-fusion protein)
MGKEGNPAMTTDETNTTTTDTTPKPDVHSVETVQDPGRPQRGLGRLAFLLLAAATIALGVVIYSGIQARVVADTNLKRATEQAATPTVNVVYPKADAPTEEIVLPGNTQAFIDAPIYARTSGYLKRWYVDIGAHVKKGQLLAEIETPEIDQQLQQARADLKTAQANFNLLRNLISFYHQAYRAAVWHSRQNHGGPLAIPLEDQLRVQAGNRPGR